MRRLAVVVVVAACGRIGFDGTTSRVNDATRDTASDVRGDAALLHTELTPSNANGGDLFGNALALSRDGLTLVAGAPREDSSATGINGNESDNSLTDAGAAYVFVQSASGWSQQAYIKASVNRSLPPGNFGETVAISADGNTLAVGQSLCDTSALATGCVEVFTRSGTTWTFLQRVTAMFADQDDLFGISVALSDDGTTLVVGAEQESSSATTINGNQQDNSSIAQGAAFVFVRSGNVYAQQAYLKAPNGENHDGFGSKVACSGDGNTVAVGAISEASGVPTDPTDNSRPQAGAVYAFTRQGVAWTFGAYIKAPMITTGDFFSSSLSLSGDGTRLVVGAPGSDVAVSNGGAVDVYTLGTTATLETTLTASIPGDTDQLGVSVAISGDGTTILAGAALEDSGSTDPNDNSAADAGAAYRFVRSGTTWTQTEYIKRATPVAGDNFGYPLAMSQDASVIAIDAGLANAAAGVVTLTYFGQ
ncbi:MAG: hypothetical protein JO257_38350 [Deltaproteobacteria bacterium]|nr:hypothetical protein [Deltaproteobacteria bacterium]